MPRSSDGEKASKRPESAVEAIYDIARRAAGEGAGAACPEPVGLDGAPAEKTGARLWALADGVAVAPLRTPTLPPATHTNCYLVGAGDVVVIDPASPYEDERAALDATVDELAARGRRVLAIWLTHHHRDHTAGAAHLASRLGVPVCAHAETARRVAADVRVDRQLGDGDTLDLPGPVTRRLRAVLTPGHAPGHLCFLEEETGLLVAGDMVAGVGTILVEPSEGDMATYLASLERMKQLAPRALLPAHGPVIADAAERLDAYVEHRLWREERVAAALAARGPARSAELVALAYDDVPAAVHPLAERSLVAHLVKLERDGRARRDGALWAVS